MEFLTAGRDAPVERRLKLVALVRTALALLARSTDHLGDVGDVGEEGLGLRKTISRLRDPEGWVILTVHLSS
jgi:hypothetical protein